MNGLLKNQFYGAFGGAVVLLAFFSAVGIGLLITGNPTLLNIFALVVATAFTFNTAANFRKEASSKWNKYELTAPVRRTRFHFYQNLSVAGFGDGNKIRPGALSHPW